MLRRLFGKEEELTQDEAKLEASLQKTRSTFFDRIGTIFQAGDITDDLWDELEEALIVGDVGMETTMKLVEATRARVEREGVRTTNDPTRLCSYEATVRLIELFEGPEPALVMQRYFDVVTARMLHMKTKLPSPEVPASWIEDRRRRFGRD